MFKKLLFFLSFLTLFIIHYSLFPAEALAVCPVCTIAVGAGLGLSRFLGVDDTVSGLWVGGLIISSSFWLVNFITDKYKPKIKKLYLQIIVVIASSLLIFIPLYSAQILGHPGNRILGIDKLIFGSGVGSAIFLFSLWCDQKVRQKKGKQLFNYQKIVFPVAGLVIASLISYFLTLR